MNLRRWFDGGMLTRWQRGWSLARGWTAYRTIGPVTVVHVGEPDRQLEHFTTEAHLEFALRLVRSAPHPPGTVRLTVLTDDPDRIANLVRPLTVRATPRLMTITLAEHPQHPVPAPYELQTTISPGRVHAEIRYGDQPVARGTVGLHRTDAVPDMVSTDAPHQRRGLGRALMTALVTEARSLGATTGILAASRDGEHLYESLGWTGRHHLVFVNT